MKLLNLKEYTKIHHLSDVDLDGYSSQFFLNEYNKEYLHLDNKDIIFSNAKREEITQKIKSIFSEISKDRNEKHLLLITDLSLEDNHVKKINNFIRGNSHISLEIQLLDHHITGQKKSEENDWYHMDIDNCSARLTYLWLEKNLGKNKKLYTTSLLVQSYDLWLEDSKYFNRGIFLSNIIMEKTTYPKLLREYEREENFYFIDEIGKLVNDDKNLEYIENLFYDLQREFLYSKIEKIAYNENLSLQDKRNIYFKDLIDDDIIKDISIFNDDKEFLKYFENNNKTDFIKQSKLYLENNAKQIGYNKYFDNDSKNSDSFSKKDLIKFEKKDSDIKIIENIISSYHTFDLIKNNKSGYYKSPKKKILNDNIKNIKFPYHFKDIEKKYNKHILKNIEYMLLTNVGIQRLEEKMLDIKKSFFINRLSDEFLNNNDLSFELKLNKLFFEKMILMNDDFEVINFKNLKSKIIFDMGMSYFQIVSSDFLRYFDKEIDFMIHISKDGKLSMRTRKEGVNVAEISQEYFNGGGHTQASGGKMNNVYIKTQLEAEKTIIKHVKEIEKKIEQNSNELNII